MDIVIIANFCGDFSGSDNGRFKYLANILCKENDVEIITSDFYHVTKKHRRKKYSNFKYKVTYISEPGYKKNVCVARFFSHWLWGKRVQSYLKNRKKPDVIYAAVPSLTAPYVSGKYAKKNSIRYIIDIQDLWPESFKMIINIPLLSDALFFPFNLIANRIYMMADDICAVSYSFVDRALKVNKKCNHGYAIYLGTVLECFDFYSTKLVEKNNIVTLGYSGTLGKSYDLKCVFDALRQVEIPIRFLVIGDGPQKGLFEKYADGLDVVFYGRLPYEKMVSILTTCDIVVNPIVGKSAASIINKHADYAACGLPVLNTQNSQEYRDLVDKYQMGYNIYPSDSKGLAKKIKELAENEELRNVMGENARQCAEEMFCREKTYSTLVDVITQRVI